MKTALIIVDIQNDFCAGGSLAVKDAELIIPIVNSMTEVGKFDLVVATQDLHPANHKSFASNNGKEIFSMGELNGKEQRMWPDHCVEGTFGAEMHPDLDMSNVSKVFPKGTNPEVDSYSGFFDNDKTSSTGLGEYLKEQGVECVFIVGLAEDVCVMSTAIDAKDLGFETHVVHKATKAVNLIEGDEQRAIEKMVKHNIQVIRS